VHTALPRRCCFVMTGASRTAWKHSVSKVLPPASGAAAPPSWNPLGVRRSLTLRSTKTYNYEALAAQLPACSGNAAATTLQQQRMAAQRIHWPEKHDNGNAYSITEVEQVKARADKLLRELASGGSLHAPASRRLLARDAPFLPHVSAATRALYSNDPQPPYVPLGRAHAYYARSNGGGAAGFDDGGEDDPGAGDEDALQRAIAASLRDVGGAGARGGGAAAPSSRKRAREAPRSSKAGAAAVCVVDLTEDDEDVPVGRPVAAHTLAQQAVPAGVLDKPPTAAADDVDAPVEALSVDELRRARLVRFT